MTSKMLGIGAKHTNEQVWDAVGEISNVVAGNFKNKIPGIADRCLLSVPTVITGANYSCHPPTDSEALEVLFRFEGSLISVSLRVHS